MGQHYRPETIGKYKQRGMIPLGFPRCECVCFMPLVGAKDNQCQNTARFNYQGRLVCTTHANSIINRQTRVKFIGAPKVQFVPA